MRERLTWLLIRKGRIDRDGPADPDSPADRAGDDPAEGPDAGPTD